MPEPKYDPATAFGNVALIKKLDAEEADKIWNEKSVVCKECNGAGGKTCDLDFDHECNDCDGRGRIEK